MAAKILSIDDDTAITELLGMLLKSHGFEVQRANDGFEGVMSTVMEPPDIILLDLIMPTLDGWEVCKIIRGFSTVPIIILSALDDPAVIENALDAGADDYLVKPISSSILVAHINRLITSEHRKTNQGEKETLLDKITSLKVFVSHLEQIIHSLLSTNIGLQRKINKLEKVKAPSQKKIKTYSTSDLDKYRNFMASVAHSIKGELSHIKFAADNLLESSKGQDDAKSEYELLTRSCDYSFLLMQKVMNFLDMGAYEAEIVDLREVNARVKELTQQRLPAKGIELKFIEKKLEKQPLVIGNNIQILNVVKELIDNAINELRGKSGEIIVSLWQNESHTLITVKDTGNGIPSEIRERIFKEHISNGRGSGWGLYLCYKTIKDLGGDLELKSDDRKGTEVTIAFETGKSEEANHDKNPSR